jgi:hypothetical protein
MSAAWSAMAASAQGRPARPLRVLVDTNLVLDQLLQREPWYNAAQPFWQARDAGVSSPISRRPP